MNAQDADARGGGVAAEGAEASHGRAILAYALKMQFFLGLDGGGTKTDAVLMSEAGTIAAKAQAGPSNPLRVGFGSALAAIREAADRALAGAGAERTQLAGICAGLAGAGPPESAEKMRSLLAAEFPGVALQVCTDLDLALAATGRGPALVLIAGTGSGAIGRNAKGETARAGAYGSQIGDEGSAYEIGRRAVLTAMREQDRTGKDSELGKRLLRELGCANWSEVKTRAQTASDEVFPRMFSVVAALAESGDATAQGILRAAAYELTGVAVVLAQRLRLSETEFLLAKMGGMTGRSKFLDELLGERLRVNFPQARIGALPMTPAEAAGRMALELREGSPSARA